jgi:hypothetical protein
MGLISRSPLLLILLLCLGLIVSLPLVHLQLSLLVHPDKCKHPKAPEAFAGSEPSQQWH